VALSRVESGRLTLRRRLCKRGSSSSGFDISLDPGNVVSFLFGVVIILFNCMDGLDQMA
jgi:hypothetical protein